MQRFVALALLAASVALGAAPPVMPRDAPVPAASISAEQLHQLPASRELRTILDYHNKLRAEFGSPPLRWNNELAAGASAYAPVLSSGGTLAHAPREGRKRVRENLLQSPRGLLSAQRMVERWGAEKRFFRPGTFPNVSSDGNWQRIAHYTQMVWPGTTDIGCTIYTDARFDWLICRYSPPGNQDGVALGPTFPTVARNRDDGLCDGPGGTTIPCGNPPGETVQDDGGGGAQDTGKTEEVACAVDVNLHRPISVDPEEHQIDDALELAPGATTLRNDDSDWRIGREVPPGDLPVINLGTDIGRQRNANENDLVKVDPLNPANLPGVYVFAFPTHSELDRALGIQVKPVNGGRHASPQELAYFAEATKATPAPALPLLVPAGAPSFWVEGMLGGQYRLVIGKLKPGILPGDVRYDRNTGKAYSAKDEKKKETPFECEDQATLTVAVIDIFQEKRSKRLTAFDVYWAGRPHFRAEVWPGGQKYSWGEQYRLGAALHAMPGKAVDNAKVATMIKDAEDVKDDANAALDGPTATGKGNAGGNFGQKGKLDNGGFQMDSPQQGKVPTVNRDATDRYRDRVSLEYEVNGEKLVRPEYLEVILPQIRAPAASGPTAGSATGVASNVQYDIVDAFDRKIKAQNTADYVDLFGAGLKAWEALGGQPNRVVERGPNFQPDAYNDYLFITAAGVDDHGNQRDPIGPLGTAQRSQTNVREDRMKDAHFQDTLVFNAPNDVNAREALWLSATGREGATPEQTRQNIQRAVNEATSRHDALEGRPDPNKRYKNAAERAADIRARRAAVPGADQTRITSSPVLSIPQDVILQLRIGSDRKDVMVFEGNTLSIFAPYFLNDNKYVGEKSDAVFRYHIRFAPGHQTSQIVPANHRRP